MREDNPPLVSIGVPVYNGAEFIKEALESIINQTYKHLEIIISDNASSDGTQEICEAFEKRDKRITYLRYDENQGASVNFNTTFEKSHGKYFKWAAHDDYLHESYISKMVSYLETNPDTHLCHCRKDIVDKNSKSIAKLDYPGVEFDEEKTYDRFKAFLKTFRYFQDDADVFLGVYRREELAKTQLVANYHSSDFTLTAESVLLGKIHIVPEYIFYRRFHKGMSTEAYASKKDRAIFFNANKKGSSLAEVSPFLVWFSEFQKFINKSNMNLMEKAVLKIGVCKWLLARIYYRVVVRNGFKHPSDFGKVTIHVE